MTPHRPGRPSTPEPPRQLKQLKREAARHAGVARAGLTTTEDGRWALQLWLERDVDAPLADLEGKCGGHPIIYESAPSEPPVARPAYPSLGE